jgi:hypothetical protein
MHANWLAQGLILRKIKENCRYSIKTNLDEGKTMMKYLQNYSYDWCFLHETTDRHPKVQLTNKQS